MDIIYTKLKFLNIVERDGRGHIEQRNISLL